MTLKGGGQQQNPPDQSLDLFLIIGLIAVVTIVSWYYYSEKIVQAIFAIRLIEAKAVLAFLNVIERFSELVHEDVIAIAYLKSSINYMENVSPGSVTYKDLYQVSARFGAALSLPAIIIGSLGVVYCLFFHRFSRFNQVYSMTSLARQEVKNWPQISCVLGKGLIKQDVRKGEWRMSDQPLSFAKKHGLLRQELVKGQTVARLEKEKAAIVFCAQMGPLWSGLEGLPPYVLALFAIFCAKAENDSEGARSLLRSIAASAASGSLDFGGTRLLLFKHVRSKRVGKAVSPHAYLYTVMASMITLARRDGVLSVSEFLWLKPLDRKLWYVLSNVGRQTTFVEVAGPMGHWMVECRLRRPLKVPVVEQAVEALDEALANILINLDEE
ncbi:type IVB secretion system coupling complex protein DotM/IcmP [Candidatus Synchoanobacter obligatus]|uniref:Type IVB secretion system coupling complex protein DotM/IcmP n=1 Tax=Candidatus Synchoanobacter obligatus TaxID=2919597 RepID=A0ABT1L5J8_9GAMM|nr:type IVB secretion system coupling complex protein DotM/IcmP [Candidatus Synchoanobacter obligatus]MCP8352369.1 type IVB secretion system coupling complex protein DotM/IcmP [Candidatus Synchoanobacter obligatus]